MNMEGKSYEEAIEIDLSLSDDDEVVEVLKPSAVPGTRRGLLMPSKRQGTLQQPQQTTRKKSSTDQLNDLFGLEPTSSPSSEPQNSERSDEIASDHPIDPSTNAPKPKIPVPPAVSASNSRASENSAGSKRHWEETNSTQPFIIHLDDSDDEGSVQEIQQPRKSFVGRNGRRMVSGGTGTREDPLSLDSSEDSDEESEEDSFPFSHPADKDEKAKEVVKGKDDKDSIEIKEARERAECLGALRKRSRPDDQDTYHGNYLSPQNNTYPRKSPDRSVSGKDQRREKLRAMKNGVLKTMPHGWSPTKSSPSRITAGANLRLPPKEGRSARAIHGKPLSPRPPTLVRVHEKLLPKSKRASLKINTCVNSRTDKVGREITLPDHSHPTTQQHLAKRQPENQSLTTSTKPMDSEQESTERYTMTQKQQVENEKEMDKYLSTKNESNNSPMHFEKEKMSPTMVTAMTSLEESSSTSSTKPMYSQHESNNRLVDTMPHMQQSEDEKKMDDYSSSKNEYNDASMRFEKKRITSTTVASMSSMEESFNTALEDDEIDFGDFGSLPLQDEYFNLDNEPMLDDKLQALIVFEDDKRDIDTRHQSTEPLDDISNELLQLQNLDDHLPPLLPCVEHMSEKYICDETGLPTWRFTVFSENDEILYDFQLFAAKSQIPGAGYGAFLEFIGARRLRAECRNRGRMILNQQPIPYEPQTLDPLDAIFEGHESAVTVRLKGENLHGNMNCSYWSMDPSIALKARIPKDHSTVHQSLMKANDKVRVRVVGEEIFHCLEFEAFVIRDSSILKPVGHFGVYTAADYKIATDITVFPRDIAIQNCIDIGRYGPFRKEDRKPEELFALKSFLFSQEPNEWSFGVAEKLGSRDQVIDITDDASGETSLVARREIPMYVNEVGYSNHLSPNVFHSDGERGRVVQYFVKLDDGLEKCKPIELLTSYQALYENVRDRKGYGIRHLLRQEPSDDESLAFRLFRNFDDRLDAKGIVSLTDNIFDLYKLVKFISEKIGNPIFKIIKDYFTAVRSDLNEFPTISTNQWIAARRIQWLMSVFQKKLIILSESKENIDNLLFQFYSFKIDQILDGLDASLADVLSLDHNLRTSNGASIRDVMNQEMLEEICFWINHGDSLTGVTDIHVPMPRPMDDSLYCPVAQRLIHRLCEHVSCFLLSSRSYDFAMSGEVKQNLATALYESAVSAKEEVLQCCASSTTEGLGDLSFGSGILKNSVFSGSVSEILAKFKTSSSFFLDHRSTPKGFRAAVIEKLHFTEMMSIAGLAGCCEDKIITVDTEGRFVMAKYNFMDGHDDVRELASLPVHISKVGNGYGINLAWYINWQVIWIVNLFAITFLNDNDYFSLEDLCRRVDNDMTLASFVTMRGMKHDNEEYCSCWLPPSGESLRSQLNWAHRVKQDYEQELETPLQPRQNPQETETIRKPKSVKKPIGAAKTQRKKALLATLSAKSTKVSKPKEYIPPQDRPRAKLIREGPPTTPFPANGGVWPPGWTERIYQRASGESKGGLDYYWYPPEGAPKLRSRPDILRFLQKQSKK